MNAYLELSIKIFRFRFFRHYSDRFSLENPGDSFGVNFTGKYAHRVICLCDGNADNVDLGFSAGIYGEVLFGRGGETPPAPPVKFQYEIDQGPPVNFTLANPFQDEVASISNQLLIQTRTLSKQTHFLHLNLLEQEYLGYFQLWSILIQNKTQPANLEVVPSTSTHLATLSAVSSTPSTLNPVFSNIPTSAISNTHQMSHGAIAAIVVSVLVVALICAWIWKSTTKKRKITSHNAASLVMPFTPPDPSQSGRFRLAQYMTMEKTDKYRQAFRVPNLVIERQVPLQSSLADGVVRRERPRRPRRVCYRVHKDAGAIEGSE